MGSHNDKLSSGIFTSKSSSVSSELTRQVLDKCLREISQEPEGMAAYLGSALISCLVGNQAVEMTQGVLEYVLKEEAIMGQIKKYTELQA